MLPDKKNETTAEAPRFFLPPPPNTASTTNNMMTAMPAGWRPQTEVDRILHRVACGLVSLAALVYVLQTVLGGLMGWFREPGVSPPPRPRVAASLE